MLRHMSATRHDPRCHPVPDHLRRYVCELVEELGVRGAAERTGLSRSAVLSIKGGLRCQRGTIAITELSWRDREAA